MAIKASDARAVNDLLRSRLVSNPTVDDIFQAVKNERIHSMYIQFKPAGGIFYKNIAPLRLVKYGESAFAWKINYALASREIQLIVDNWGEASIQVVTDKELREYASDPVTFEEEGKLRPKAIKAFSYVTRDELD